MKRSSPPQKGGMEQRPGFMGEEQSVEPIPASVSQVPRGWREQNRLWGDWDSPASENHEMGGALVLTDQGSNR